MKKIFTVFCILLLVFLCGCQKTGTDNGKIKIVTTVFAEYDFARAITGDLAEISLLVPPGSDIHSFEPTLNDIASIKNSDVFIYIGGEGDAWLNKVLESIGSTQTTVIKMSDYVCLVGEHSGQEHTHSHSHSHGENYDEHIWTSPDNAKLMLYAIAEVLGEKYSNYKSLFTANAAEYSQKIDQANKALLSVIESGKTKKIVVADRFPYKYFTEYYQLDAVAAFGGCQENTDADLATVARLINTVKEYNLPAVFKTEQSGSVVAATVAEHTGVQVLELHSMQNISAEDFDSGITYADIMLKNAQVLKIALKGQ